MAREKSKRSQVVDELSLIFRDKGYAGASLSDLSKASGLGRASLYHHFPGGKEDMARAVLAQAGQQFAKLVIAPLDRKGPPLERLMAMIDGMEAFYAQGPLACLTNTMTMGGDGAQFRENIAQSLNVLVQKAEKTLKELGIEKDKARDIARDIPILLHGALVVGRVGDDRSIFTSALERLKQRIKELAK